MTSSDASVALPAVEAVIVSFNSASTLLDCCESLLRTPNVARVRVVDNSPGGADARRLAQTDLDRERLRVSVSGGNRGFGPAVNHALAEVEADYVAIVNPDGAVEEETIPRLLKALTSNSRAVLAGARLLDEAGREQQGSRRREPTPLRLVANTLARGLRWRAGYKYGFEMSDDRLPAASTAVDAISGACMLGRVDALRAINGFDEGFFLHFEDLDLCKRVRDAGGKILFVPDAVFHHQGGGSSASRPYFVIWHKHRSMVKYYLKHYRRLGGGGEWLPLVIMAASGRCLFKMLAEIVGVHTPIK